MIFLKFNLKGQQNTLWAILDPRYLKSLALDFVLFEKYISKCPNNLYQEQTS